MSTRGSDNTGEIRELLSRHLSGETSDEERERIREILDVQYRHASNMEEIRRTRHVRVCEIP